MRSIAKFVRTTSMMWSVGFVILSGLPVYAQQQDNLDRYWSYRERFREDWIVISSHVEEFGNNIPANDKEAGNVSWGDANNMFNHYLTMLATELWLLKNNEQDYSETLAELFYVMHAMERLDVYTELHHRILYGYPVVIDPTSDRNGMANRDDITPGFWNANKAHFGGTGNDYSPGHPHSVMSQDVLYHNVEGLAMVAKLVGTESVAGIPITFVENWTPNYLAYKGIQSGDNVNFSAWAQDILTRSIGWFQWADADGPFDNHHEWQLRSRVSDDPVVPGDGFPDAGLFFNIGLIQAGIQITGTDWRHRDAYGAGGDAELMFMDIFLDGKFGLIQMNDDVNRQLRSLATTSNILGPALTASILRARRDAPDPFDHEHHPLYSYILYDDPGAPMEPSNAIFNSERAIIENLLDAAPDQGPYGSHSVWNNTSRLVWPEGGGQHPSAEYSGLDYMVLHNLYYAAFRREDYRDLSIPLFTFPASQYRSGDYYRRRIETYKALTAESVVSYNGHKGVTLKTGFHAPAGCSFRATNNARPNNYDGSLYKVPGSPMRASEGKPRVVHTASPSNEVYSILADAIVGTAPEAGKPLAKDPWEGERRYAIFPNPAKQSFTISSPLDVPDGSYMELMTTHGQVLQKVRITGRAHTINVSELANGTYVLKLYVGEEVAVRKVSVVN